MTLSYRQPSGGTGTVGWDYSVDNLTYRVAFASDLMNPRWVSGTNWIEWTGDRTDNSDGSETVTVRLRQPMGSASAGFLRLTLLTPTVLSPAQGSNP